MDISMTKCLAYVLIPLAISPNAISKEVSYDFIQGSYAAISADIDGAEDIDGDGLGVSGSFTVAPNIAFTAGFAAVDYERYLGVSIDTTQLDFGITGFFSAAEGTSIFGNFSIVRADIEATDGFTTLEDDDTGNQITVGIRHLATAQVELDASFTRIDVFDESDTGFGIGARFYATEKVSLGIGYGSIDDTDAISFNARLDFK